MNFPHPARFAVLLNGPWGIGKTYLIRNFTTQATKNGKKCVYVSLFGLSTVQEFDEVLMGALRPILNNKVVQFGGRFATIGAKFARLENPIKASDVIEWSKSDLIIFDDLERCPAPLNTILGYINALVEHEDRKVVIVANEKEIIDKEAYKNRREKLIGKSFEVQSSFDDAFADFIKTIENKKLQKLFLERKDQISDLYTQSELNNLRILQQSMWDFERVYSVFSDHHTDRAGAMAAVLRMFLSLSFEYKAGRIDANDLNERPNSMQLLIASMNPDKVGGKGKIEVAIERYKGEGLTDGILTNQTLSDILARGIVDKDRIQQDLNRSSYFVGPGQEPVWRTVWHRYERSDDDVVTAFMKMEQNFTERQFTITGEILHVFGLRLSFAGTPLLPKNTTDISSECKKYIDDIYADKKIEPRESKYVSDIDFMAYDGLGFAEYETGDFKELAAYLREKQEAANLDLRPAQAEELLTEMKKDAGLFYRRLNLTNSEDNKYYDIPILSYIAPDRFAEVFFQSDVRAQRGILLAIKERHKDSGFATALLTEKPWIAAVKDRIHAECATLNAWGALRIKKELEFTLDTIS
jgi:hypothetical protein